MVLPRQLSKRLCISKVVDEVCVSAEKEKLMTPEMHSLLLLFLPLYFFRFSFVI